MNASKGSLKTAKKTGSNQRPAKNGGHTTKSLKSVKAKKARAKSTLMPSTLDALPATDEASRQAIRLSFLIHDVSRMRRAAYDQLMKPFNFTRARWWVLAHLSRHDGMMQSQLADVLDVGKASLGSVIEQLETDGWLERRPDPSDKRAKRVYLTRAAQSFIKKMTLEEDNFNSRVLINLNGDDRAELIRLLILIKEALQQFSQINDDTD